MENHNVVLQLQCFFLVASHENRGENGPIVKFPNDAESTMLDLPKGGVGISIRSVA